MTDKKKTNFISNRSREFSRKLCLDLGRFRQKEEKMISRASVLLFLTTVLVFTSHCATSSAGLATSTVPIVDKKYKVIAPVEGTKYWLTFDIAIIGIPLGEPPIDRLLEELKREKEADALVNVRYWTDKTIIVFLTVNRLHVSADAIKFEEDTADPRKKGR